MTQAQRNFIASPATGLMIYQTDATAGFYFYNGSAWMSLSGNGDNLGNHTATQSLTSYITFQMLKVNFFLFLNMIWLIFLFVIYNSKSLP